VAPAHYSSFRGHEVYREVQGAGSSGGDLAGMERDEAESATAPNVQRSLKFKLLLLGGPGRSPAKRENSVKLPKFHALELNAHLMHCQVRESNFIVKTASPACPPISQISFSSTFWRSDHRRSNPPISQISFSCTFGRSNHRRLQGFLQLQQSRTSNSGTTPPVPLFKTSLDKATRAALRLSSAAGAETVAKAAGHRCGSRLLASRPRRGRRATAVVHGRWRRDRGEGGGAPRRSSAAGVETAAREAGHCG
jgi:hypothetical protein